MDAHPSVRVEAAAYFHAAQKTLLHGFSSTVFQKHSTAWSQWRKYYKWMEITDNLQGIGDSIPFLYIFANRLRASLLSDRSITIKKRSMEQHLCSIGHIFAAVGANDPRHNKLGKLNFCLGR